MSKTIERQRDWENCYRSQKRKTCKTTPIILVVEPKRFSTGTRRAETCVAPRHADASRDLYSLFSKRVAWGEGEGDAARLSYVLSFPGSIDHARDWPPCKVIFSGWQPKR